MASLAQGLKWLLSVLYPWLFSLLPTVQVEIATSRDARAPEAVRLAEAQLELRPPISPARHLLHNPCDKGCPEGMAGQDANLRPSNRWTGGCKRWEGAGRAPLADCQFGSLNTGWLSQHFLGHSGRILSFKFGDQVPHTEDSESPSVYRPQGRAELLPSIRWEIEPREEGGPAGHTALRAL